MPSTSVEKLGRLERVGLREVWESEPQGFTPWLAREENLKLLGDTVGFELELEAQEKSVGPFRADLLCKDTADGNWVLIENQLEATDHIHLGQLITYAAGLKAVAIIWVARQFTDDHRAALDWLNEITDDRFTFFGLEVELWRIGGSAIAPKFNIVSKPNDWSKTVSSNASRLSGGDLTEAKRLQLEFWTEFRRFVQERDSTIKPRKPSPHHWMNIALGRTGVHLAAIASLYDSESGSYDRNELRAEVVLRGEMSKEHFAALWEQKDEITDEVEEEMTWYNPEGKTKCRIYLRHAAEIANKDHWPEYHGWLLEKLETLHRVFSQRAKRLPSTPAVVDEAVPEVGPTEE